MVPKRDSGRTDVVTKEELLAVIELVESYRRYRIIMSELIQKFYEFLNK